METFNLYCGNCSVGLLGTYVYETNDSYATVKISLECGANGPASSNSMTCPHCGHTVGSESIASGQYSLSFSAKAV